jgi:hypothetical protein
MQVAAWYVASSASTDETTAFGENKKPLTMLLEVFLPCCLFSIFLLWCFSFADDACGQSLPCCEKRMRRRHPGGGVLARGFPPPPFALKLSF